MATRDFYNVLGVERSASPDEIKRAYRGLAMRWHPDRNPDDPVAEQRFKDITEAYHTLSDPDRRSRYDRLGPLYNADGRPPRPEEVNEVVSAMFGNLFGRRRPARGEDLRYTLSLTLEEVAAGVEKEVVVPRMVRCRTCAGQGADPEGGREKCKVCDGSGRATGPRLFRTDCYHCEGKGYVVTRACPTCTGEGVTPTDDTLVVKVPKGVATGQKLKLQGKGNAPRGSGAEGDLYVVVNVAEHPLFRRRGDDVLVEVPLTISELALGADVAVPTLEGRTTIKVPSGTQPGRILRLGTRGLPRVGRAGRGDLHLQLVLEVPEGLSAEEQEVLALWASALPSTVHPRRAAFAEAVEERKPG